MKTLARNRLALYLLSLLSASLLFWIFFWTAGFFIKDFLISTFGPPREQAVSELDVSYAFISFLASALGGIFGLLIAIIILHRLGLYLKISVLKPSLLGFLTFLLLLFLYLLYLGR